MAGELEGKVAVVTGAASGIGLASAEAMLAAGARVAMVDRDKAALAALHAKPGEAVLPLVQSSLPTDSNRAIFSGDKRSVTACLGSLSLGSPIPSFF